MARCEHGTSIPYWLCGVNFKIFSLQRRVAWNVYHIDSVESTSKWPRRNTSGTPQVYHIDSVESTSKFIAVALQIGIIYTILTLWSQLQNGMRRGARGHGLIPYWLCGVNFKIDALAVPSAIVVYHIDSVESTSKFPELSAADKSHYTILTLWSQLQNAAVTASIFA